MSDDIPTPEERYRRALHAWDTALPPSDRRCTVLDGLEVAMIQALSARIDSLDAEIERVTAAIRKLEGARS